MISWIVASHREDVLQNVLLASLGDVESLGDEVVIVRDAPSVTVAYAAGQEAASNPVRVFVHHDVRVLDVPALRTALILRTGQVNLGTGAPVGMVGLIGSRDVRMPWWDGDMLGSVIDTRMGKLGPGPGGLCAMLDGLLLATRQTVPWDTDAPGWHGYDHDACSAMLSRGLTNWCLSDGHLLAEHVNESTSNLSQLRGWDEAVARWRQRWQ